MYSADTKKKAEQLRARGVPYSKLTEKFGVPKSTLSYWFSEKYEHIYNTEARLKHLAKSRPKALAAIQERIRKNNDFIKLKVKREIKKYPLGNIGLQKSVLASLYWAEGSKHSKVTGLKFANSDPKLAQFFIELLRKSFPIDNKKFRLGIYLHYYHNERECKKFWSKTLEIPESQFWKTYWKKRSKRKKFRKNFMGVCFIYYSDSNIRKEIMEICDQMHRILCPRSSADQSASLRRKRSAVQIGPGILVAS